MQFFSVIARGSRWTRPREPTQLKVANRKLSCGIIVIITFHFLIPTDTSAQWEIG